MAVALVLIVSIQDVLADSEKQNEKYTDFFIPAVYPIENAWNNEPHDFRKAKLDQSDALTAQDLNAIEPAAHTPQQDALNYKSEESGMDEKEWVGKVLKKLPYKNTIKYTWDVMEGDVDLMDVKNFRADVGNRGVTYKTNYIPLMGNVEGTHIQADLGKDTELKFESDYFPLIGRKDGLKFKASVGDGANISLRYKKDISW